MEALLPLCTRSGVMSSSPLPNATAIRPLPQLLRAMNFQKTPLLSCLVAVRCRVSLYKYREIVLLGPVYE